MRKNVAWFGFLYGTLMPWAGLLIFYLLKMRYLSLGAFFQNIFSDGQLAAKVFSLVLLINLIPFLIFYNRRWDHAAKGVLIATFLYALFIIWLRFIK